MIVPTTTSLSTMLLSSSFFVWTRSSITALFLELVQRSQYPGIYTVRTLQSTVFSNYSSLFESSEILGERHKETSRCSLSFIPSNPSCRYDNAIQFHCTSTTTKPRNEQGWPIHLRGQRAQPVTSCINLSLPLVAAKETNMVVFLVRGQRSRRKLHIKARHHLHAMAQRKMVAASLTRTKIYRITMSGSEAVFLRSMEGSATRRRNLWDAILQRQSVAKSLTRARISMTMSSEIAVEYI